MGLLDNMRVMLLCCLQVAPPPPVLSPGAAAGVAVGGMAALCGVVGLAVWLLHRRKQQNNPADKDDGASSQGSGRRVSEWGSLQRALLTAQHL